jgi:murein DD-endopeptidase MepM/ murein hydrolase activator NlpD
MTGRKTTFFLALAFLLTGVATLTGCTAIDDATDDGSGRSALRSGYVIAVEPGETLDDVARRMRVSREALIQANRLRPPYALEASQPLLIPPPATYRVRPGDTVEGIAVTLGVDEEALADANGLRRPYHMRVNQVLCVPGGIGGDGAPIAETAEPGFEGVAPPPRSTISAQPLPPPAAGGSGGFAAPPQQPTPPPYAPPPYQAPPYQPPAYQPPPVQPQPYGAPTALAPRPESRPTPRIAQVQPPEPRPAPAEAAPAAAPPAANGTPRFLRPVAGEVVLGFGPDGSGQTNDGINIAAPAGTPVRAAAAGTVIYAGNELPAFGNLVLVRHDGGWVTAYGHLDTIGVQRGASVAQGQTIGTVGQTGSAKRPQLHFEVRQGSKPVDPAPFLGS